MTTKSNLPDAWFAKAEARSHQRPPYCGCDRYKKHKKALCNLAKPYAESRDIAICGRSHPRPWAP